MEKTKTPVFIVGGGLVGLTAALCLEKHKIPYLLIERHAGTSIHPRANGMNIRTMEIFRELGIEEEIRAAGKVLEKSNGAIEAEVLAGTDLSSLKRIAPNGHELEEVIGKITEEISPVIGCACSQDQSEPVLLWKAQELGGGDFRFFTELISFEQTNTGVQALIKDRKTGREETIFAEYMIAADGAKSQVREALGMEFTDGGSFGHHINIYFQADLSKLVEGNEFIVCNITNPESPGHIIAVNNKDRWCFHVLYHPERGESPKDFPEERCVDLIRKAIGLPNLNVSILSVLPWEAASRIASHYQVGRVFLAGDAAHVMPPKGAYGANTGIQDAHNLAWKLAAVLRGEANPVILATYEQERKPVAQFAADQSVLYVTREEGHVHSLIPAIGYQYQSDAIWTEENSIIQDKLILNGVPGKRAPHIWCLYQGERISTIDLFGKNFVLFTGDKGEKWLDAAARVSSKLGITLHAYQVGDDGDLVVTDNKWQEAYGVSSEGAVLIRPDGFVAWRSKEEVENKEETLKSVFHQILFDGS
ncbi:FAD-dependent monooxygenase [Shimazuella sp. AN120528]|uniref:FAD-dependent monooxygenase n=1 Tax=Shimazuella soli TaxID=1892854 RepID=UPI001F1083A9|nr:FAD-dependent monooxygenase [Shimazuella soli]MCH5583521.1 FAD-dependent monooxygenase [Shimazuella soli]